jgi:hypothetical protein
MKKRNAILIIPAIILSIAIILLVSILFYFGANQLSCYTNDSDFILFAVYLAVIMICFIIGIISQLTNKGKLTCLIIIIIIISITFIFPIIEKPIITTYQKSRITTNYESYNNIVSSLTNGTIVMSKYGTVVLPKEYQKYLLCGNQLYMDVSNEEIRILFVLERDWDYYAGYMYITNNYNNLPLTDYRYQLLFEEGWRCMKEKDNWYWCSLSI